VNISAKTQYACIAVLELAANYGTGEPIRIRTIAQAHGIPSRFLVQILLQLKGAGLVSSTRGAAGGYQLAKDPKHVKLSEVMSVIEGQAGGSLGHASVQTTMSQALHDVWRRAAEAQHELLSSITFAELVERVRGQTDTMYYI
jgi:Rrf2 family protein